ncbi:MAG TPA: MFS transporter [Bryobacteraceae bacterium]|nr:MFS transporter [Bryobacteraceae bacterium]
MLQRVFKAFQYRDFRLMWIGACTSSIGSWMQIMAQAWLVYNISHGNAFYLGLDAFLGNIPVFLFSLLGGALADRFDRRYVLLASQYVQMADAVVLTILVFTNSVHVWQVLMLSFVSGLAQAFGGPAYQALIPTLVNKEDMPNAIALNSIQFNVARILGPTLGGIAMADFGDAWCFGLNAISFFAPVISLNMIKARFSPVKTGESILASIKGGIAYVRKLEGMESLMVLAFCMTALGIPMLTFLPVFVRMFFNDDKRVYTLFLVCSGIGSILGSLAVASLGNSKHKGRIALTMLVCLGAGISGFALSKSVVISGIMLFVSGAALISVFAMVSSLVQVIITNEMRGRVMSVYNVAFRGGMPLGNLVVGWVVQHLVPAPVALAVNGVLLMMLALYFLLLHRRIAEL